jgi:hypothetical protein
MNKPFWKDECGHGGYLFSLTILEGGILRKYDIYYFDNPHDEKTFCFRYGNEGHEYISPGKLTSIITGTIDNTLYCHVYDWLLRNGKIEWVPK